MKVKPEESFYIKIAECVIQVKMTGSQHVIFRQLFVENFKQMWKGVMCHAPKSVDFVIECELNESSVKTIIKNKTLYMGSWVWDYKIRKLRLENLGSLWILQMAIRQVVMHLLKGKGFLLHASAVLTSRGKMQIFLAESGGGKSTTAKRASELGAKYIADDSVIVKRVEGGWKCFAPGMVEKAQLADNSGSSEYDLNLVIKAPKIRRYEPDNLAQKLSLIIKQVWLLDETMDKRTYEMVVSFVRSSRIYYLELPLQSRNLLEVLDEN